jgi:hypothetical protein
MLAILRRPHRRFGAVAILLSVPGDGRRWNFGDARFVET